MRAILATIIDSVSKLRSVLRLKPGEVGSVGGRSRERYRRIALSAITATAGRFISLGTSVITVPLTLRYLGTERYGMWMTITSFVIMLGFADLGMSNGLVNMIADAVGRDDRAAARRATSSAFWMLSAIALLLLIVGAIAYPFVPWSSLFNVHSAAATRESGPALIVFLTCFAVGLPLGAVGGIRNGLQSAYSNNVWSIAGSILSLVGLLAAIHFHAGLPVLILALSGAPILTGLMNSGHLFFRQEPYLRPSLEFFSKPTAHRLLRTGMMFFSLNLASSIGFQSDNIVIAQILGAKAVASYAIPARLFNLVTSFLVTVSGSMWPAYADALARSDGHWIRRTYWRTTILGSGVAGLVTVFLIIFGNRILSLWVGPQIQASAALLAVFGVRCLLSAYLQPITFLLNGLGQIRSQVVVAFSMAIVNLALSIFFVFRFGIIGAVLGTVVAEILVVVIPQTIIVNRLLKRISAA